MNLQLCAPYAPCIYHCPFCVARGHKHKYNFQNLYEENKKEYIDNLLKILEYNEFNSIVITGECDPTQWKNWINLVTFIITKAKQDACIELQTHNFNISPSILKEINVLAYSLTNLKDYLNSWRYLKPESITTRGVIILNKEFECLNKDNFSSMGFDQITFKQLNYGEDENINKWIDKNRVNDLSQFYDIMNAWNGSKTSIRVDETCQDATDRYVIFRSDGKLYDSWENNIPIKIKN